MSGFSTTLPTPCPNRSEGSVNQNFHPHYDKVNPRNIGLPVPEVIRSSNTGHYLLILSQEPFVMFAVHEAKDSSKPLSTLSIQSTPEAVARIKAAWEMGVEEALIALAYVDGTLIHVVDCNLRTWEIPFLALSELSGLDLANLPNFELDEDGSFLYWECVDAHFDMEALRLLVDPALRERLKAETLLHDESFGKAIASVRKSFQLNQSDIPSVSERHMRRIEKGARPKIETLRHLAEAHKLSLNDYLEKVAEAIAALSCFAAN